MTSHAAVIPDHGDTRAELQMVAGERDGLDAWLEFYRSTLILKLAALSAEQLCRRSVPPSTMSLLGLVRHLTEVERYWFTETEVAAARAAASVVYDLDAPVRGLRRGKPVNLRWILPEDGRQIEGCARRARLPGADHGRTRTTGGTMAIERARAHLAKFGLDDQIRELGTSIATVPLAAAALGTQPERIAKTLSFLVDGAPLLVVTAGDAKVANAPFKARFGVKARMIPGERGEELVGHAVGGVCPFGVNDGVPIYLDESMRRFTTVFPACGSDTSAIELTIEQLAHACGDAEWVSVCTTPGAA